MRRLFPPVTIALLLFRGLAQGEDPKIRRPLAVTGLPPIYATSLGSVTASPSTVSFSATDPDLGTAPGNSQATITWTESAGNPIHNWTLTVRGGSSFSGCSTVPASAVTVTCTSASVSGGGGTGTCSAPFALSAGGQQVAGGLQGNNTQTWTYTVTINFTIADRWSYVAQQSPPCTITLTYTVNAP